MGDGSGEKRWEEERTTFQRVYDVLVEADPFLSAEEFADRARCSEGGARNALEQLREMGIAERRDGRPKTYRRNDSYLRWKRIESLASEHTADELKAQADELVEQDESFQNRYGAPEPAAVATTDLEVDTRAELHGRWDDLDEWREIRQEIRLLVEAVDRAQVGTDDVRSGEPPESRSR